MTARKYARETDMEEVKRCLKGHDGDVGLIARMKIMEDWVGTQKKLQWAIGIWLLGNISALVVLIYQVGRLAERLHHLLP